MAKKYLDYDGLLYFWQKIKTVFVPTTRKVNGKALSADITLSASDVSALPSSTVIPSPGTGTNYPAMDGTKSLGSNAGYARVDHVHPSDTTRVPTSRTINTKALSGDIVLTGSDIAADSTTSTTIADALDGKVDKVSGKGLSTNDYTTAEKNKLSGIASGAEVNQNAYSNVKVGSTTIAAGAKTDTLELVAGNKITLTPDTTNDKVTIAFNGTIPTVPNNFGTVKVGSTNIVADTTSDTLELAAGSNITLTPDASNDKITIAATNTTYSDFTAPTSSAAGTHGLVPAPVAAEVNNVLFSDAKWYELDTTRDSTVVEVTRREAGQTNTEVLLTIPEVTTSAAGVMSSSDKTKLNGIATGAEKNVVTAVTSNGASHATYPNTAEITYRNGANSPTVVLLSHFSKGVANGVCPLNANKLIDSKYLPSYVDDVIEAYPRSGQTALSATWLASGSATGEVISPVAGKIYVLMADSGDYATNTQFRWGGSAYVKMADGGVSSITNAEIDTILAA